MKLSPNCCRAALVAACLAGATPVVRAQAQIDPVPVLASNNGYAWSPYTKASAYTVTVTDAANPANTKSVDVQVHKVRYHRTSDGTPTGTASPLASPPATQGDLDLVTNVYYAHFSFRGTVNVKVGTNFSLNGQSGVAKTATLSPANLGLTSTPDAGGNITFTLSDSRYIVLNVTSTTNASLTWPFQLIIIADPAESNAPVRGGTGVIDVTQAPYNAKADFSAAANAAISQALSDHANGTDIVYVPAGVYLLSGPVTARSNAKLYLAPGASLRFQDSITTTSKVYCVDGAGVSNFRLYGRGTLDANGVGCGGHQPSKTYIDNSTGTCLAGCMRIQDNAGVASSNVVVDGVVYRESCAWTIAYNNSTNLTLTNVKVINYQQDYTWYRENDGLDLVSCQNSNVSHCFVYTADDALCIKGGAAAGDPESYGDTYSDIVVHAKADGAKYGFQGYAPIHDCIFQDIVVIQAARPLAVHMEHGTNQTMQNLSFSDVTAETIRGSSSSRPFDGYLGGNATGLTVNNVVVTNFSAPLATGGTTAQNDCYVKATNNTFNGVHFHNLVLGGTPVTNSNYLTYFAVATANTTVTNLDFDAGTSTSLIEGLAPANGGQQAFSSNWKTLPGSSYGIENINDGVTVTTVEAQTSDANDAWVIWTFAAPKTITKMVVWTDQGNFSVNSAKLEYIDSTGAWITATNFATPNDESATGHPSNTSTFPAISTTRVRVTLHPASGKQVGCQEVQLFTR